MNRVAEAVRRSLIGRAAPANAISALALRRRRVVVIATLVAGTVMLGVLLRVKPGDAWFYPLAVVQAGIWAAGGLLSGPLHLGHTASDRGSHRPVLAPLVIGTALGAVFLVGALIVREIPPLRDDMADVLGYASGGRLVAATVVTVANGVAEEIFFRGALFSAAEGRRPVLVSTLTYAATTVAAGKPVLVFAAITVGGILGLQRRASGGIMAPAITHVTWSMIMLFTLPPILRL
jgi:membrane protease YdiL (CAAX protease family)